MIAVQRFLCCASAFVYVVGTFFSAFFSVCAGVTMLDSSWVLTLYHKAAMHDNRFICRWALLDLLSVDLDSSPLLSTCYWGFLFGPLMNLLSEYSIYARVDEEARGHPPAVGSTVVAFFTNFAERLPVNERQLFCAKLLSAVVRQEFSQVPLVFISRMLANLPPSQSWDSNSLISIRNIFPLFRTYNPHMSSAIQSFLLKAVIKQADPTRVHWNDIGYFLSLLWKDCLCRGNSLWDATVSWIWKIGSVVDVSPKTSNEIGLNINKYGSCNLFDHLSERLEAFLSNGTSELSRDDQEACSVVRLLVIGCDSQLNFSEISTSEKLVKDLFHQIVGVVQHASNHVYASEVRTVRAAMILAGVLNHLNCKVKFVGRESNDIAAAEEKKEIDRFLDIIASLLRSAGADIFELLLRKLTAAASTDTDSSFVFLDLSSELCEFVTSSVHFESQGLDVYYRFIKNLMQNSKDVIQKKQLDRDQLSLNDWRSFAQSLKSLALSCSSLTAHPGPQSTHLGRDMLKIIVEFDLSSEFPTPQMMYPDRAHGGTKVETRTSVKKGWGRLVSEFLEAQWCCIKFFLEEFQHFKDLDGKFEKFLEDLPEAALEALSLGSGQAVIPIMKCIQLLIPRMLCSGVPLCLQALESVWWTFQDRQKGDHFFFWRTLKEATQIFFNPCLLTLPREHPVSTLVCNYWGKLMALGEDRPGVLNHVIQPCCHFWSGLSSDKNAATLELTEKDRKKSMESHLDLLTEAFVFGPREKKTLRVTNYSLQYVYQLARQRVVCAINMDELRDDTRVRVNAVNALVMLNPKDAIDRELLESIVRALIVKNAELVEEKRKSSINSYCHRRKHRVWQAILVALSRLLEAEISESFAREVLDGMFDAILSDNQVSVRNYLQWGMIHILGR